MKTTEKIQYLDIDAGILVGVLVGAMEAVFFSQNVYFESF